MTDTTIAHQVITARGRPGHEKHAQFDYLVSRRVNLLLWGGAKNKAERYVSSVMIDTMVIPVLVYEDSIMKALAARPGVRFFDVPQGIEKYLGSMRALPRDVVRNDFQFLKKYYFDFNSDSIRERAMLDCVEGDSSNAPR